MNTLIRKQSGKTFKVASRPELIGVISCICRRLASILEKRSLSDAKLDEIKTKLNILRVFAQPKEEEKVGRAESEL